MTHTTEKCCEKCYGRQGTLAGGGTYCQVDREGCCHAPTENCSGCTDRFSEGTHQMHTIQHPCSKGGDPNCGYCSPTENSWEEKVISMVGEVANRPEPINGFQPHGMFDEAQEKQIYFDGYKDALAMRMITLTLRTKKGDTFLSRLLSLIRREIQQAEQEAYERGRKDAVEFLRAEAGRFGGTLLQKDFEAALETPS